MATEAGNTTDLVADETDGSVPEAPVEERTFPPDRGVYGRLFQEGYQFNFFQAVRLLEKLFAEAPAPGDTPDVQRERILFRPHTALVFPAADIKRIEALEEPVSRARLVLTFLGLYGVDSPLPEYFYGDLVSDKAEVDVLRDFLDIFNHRLYAYFYRAWKKYRPGVGYGIPGKDPHTGRFLSVAGLGTRGALTHARLPSPLQLAAFSGWLSPQARSAEGLQKLISAHFPGLRVQVEQNVVRWVPLPERPRMGEGGGFSLGSGAVLGARVRDRSGKFRLVLGPLDFKDFLKFRPKQTHARLLSFLVRLYAPDYLDYDVELRLDTSNIPPVRLGKGDVQVGMTTWLGKPREAVIALRMTY